MHKRTRAFVATMKCIAFSYSLCHWKCKFLWCTFRTHFSIGTRNFQNVVLKMKLFLSFVIFHLQLFLSCNIVVWMFQKSSAIYHKAFLIILPQAASQKQKVQFRSMKYVTFKYEKHANFKYENVTFSLTVECTFQIRKSGIFKKEKSVIFK